jgi:hypothetical protein
VLTHRSLSRTPDTGDGCITSSDLSAGARRRVAKPLLKRIRAILLQQAAGASLVERFPIAGLGSLTPLDLATDDSVADANDVAEHGAVGRQRERVDHLEGLVVGVVEDLGERGQGEPGLGTRLEADADERIDAAVGGGESSFRGGRWIQWSEKA